MSHAFKPSVITANALLEGDVVYLGAHDWVRDLADAEILTDEAVADIRMIEASAQTGRVVGVYLAEIDATGSRPAPVHFREAFRATGPSNYAHGKQETV